MMMTVTDAGYFPILAPSNCESKNRAMIIRIVAQTRSVEIDDPRNFKAFSVRIAGRFDDPAAQAELLGRVAVRSDREHIDTAP
jgi:hypothetical protein